MSFCESSAASSRIFAQISFALSSRTSDPSQMMRSFSSLSNTLVATRGSAMRAPVRYVASNLPAGRGRPARVRPGQSGARTRVAADDERVDARRIHPLVLESLLGLLGARLLALRGGGLS